jgi:hypothetical protein
MRPTKPRRARRATAAPADPTQAQARVAAAAVGDDLRARRARYGADFHRWTQAQHLPDDQVTGEHLALYLYKVRDRYVGATLSMVATDADAWWLDQGRPGLRPHPQVVEVLAAHQRQRGWRSPDPGPQSLSATQAAAIATAGTRQPVNGTATADAIAAAALVARAARVDLSALVHLPRQAIHLDARGARIEMGGTWVRPTTPDDRLPVLETLTEAQSAGTGLGRAFPKLDPADAVHRMARGARLLGLTGPGPVTWADLAALPDLEFAEVLDTLTRTWLTHQRDVAMVLVCRATGWRAQTLSAALPADVRRAPDGVRLFAREWKGGNVPRDPWSLAHPEPGTPDQVCPACALDRWLGLRARAGGRADLPVFGAVRAGVFRGGRLSSSDVSRSLKCLAAGAGLTGRFTSRSLRIGAATGMAESGAPLSAAQALLAHALPTTTYGYIRPGWCSALNVQWRP